MSFYVYENWTAEDKAVIHKGSCGHCKYGCGTDKDKTEGRNGMWHGSYGTYSEALNAAELLTRYETKNCKKCRPSGDV